MPSEAGAIGIEFSDALAVRNDASRNHCGPATRRPPRTALRDFSARPSAPLIAWLSLPWLMRGRNAKVNDMYRFRQDLSVRSSPITFDQLEIGGLELPFGTLNEMNFAREHARSCLCDQVFVKTPLEARAVRSSSRRLRSSAPCRCRWLEAQVCRHP
jgi:hypothetical protein